MMFILLKLMQFYAFGTDVQPRTSPSDNNNGVGLALTDSSKID